MVGQITSKKLSESRPENTTTTQVDYPYHCASYLTINQKSSCLVHNTFLQKTLRSMCKVSSCSENHKYHYCKVCKNPNSDHRSYLCPKGTIIFHGTSRQYANMIKQDGFKPSTLGRIGQGVYFTKSFNDAKRIAQYKFGKGSPVVVECFAQVDYREFKKEDSVQELLRKHQEWQSFYKNTAKQAIHPPWANCQQFREICVQDPNSIIIRKIYDV